MASSRWLFKTGDSVGGDFRSDNRSHVIIDKVSVTVIVKSKHVDRGNQLCLVLEMYLFH